MTTNLMIGTPVFNDAPGSTVTGSGTFAAATPLEAMLSGSRSRLGRLSSATTAHTITVDMGSAASRTIDFFYVARANILKAQLATRLKLAGGTSGDITGVSTTLQSLTLYGRNAEDAIFTSELANSAVGSLPSTATNQTYVVTIGQSGVDPSTKWAASKIMFGQWFDFGRDPRTLDFKYQEVQTPGQRSPHTLFTFRWSGISKTTKDAAIAALIAPREKGCILYTRSYHAPLLDRRVVHAFVDDYEVKYNAENSFDFTIRFREQI